MLKKLKEFNRLWPEWWTIAFGVVVLYLLHAVLVWLGVPAFSIYHPGNLLILAVSTIAMVAGNFVVMLGLRLNFRPLFRIYARQEEIINQLTPIQKIWLLAGFYLGLFYCFVQLVQALNSPGIA